MIKSFTTAAPSDGSTAISFDLASGTFNADHTTASSQPSDPNTPADPNPNKLTGPTVEGAEVILRNTGTPDLLVGGNSTDDASGPHFLLKASDGPTAPLALTGRDQLTVKIASGIAAGQLSVFLVLK